MTEPASDEATRAEFGELFRTAREDADMTRDQVANALHLDVAVVAAIEDGRFADLPMHPYARGYVRNYARMVGLDPDDLARRFDAADAGRAELSVVVPRHRVMPKSELALRPLALGYAAIVAGLLIALGAVLWTAWRVQDWQFPFLADDADERPIVPPATESLVGPPDLSAWPTTADSVNPDGVGDEGATVVSEPSPRERGGALLANSEPVTPTLAVAVERLASPAQAPRVQRVEDDGANPLDRPAQETRLTPERVADAASAAASGVGELTVTFDADSWVSIDDATGRQLFGDLGRNGRTVTVAGPLPLAILVGNAPAVRLEFGGESVDLEPFTSENNVARFELGGG